MAEMRKSRLAERIRSGWWEHFVAGTTARSAAWLVGVNKSTAGYYFHRWRSRPASVRPSNHTEFWQIIHLT
jgi:transposase-like protein